MNTQQARVTMFYDGGCPLCDREVAHYKRLDTANKVAWVDIDENTAALKPHGITLEAAMRRLHVTDRNGQLVTGAFAFHTLWRELPYYRWLARVVSPKFVLRALDVVYNRFAARRFARR
ncbi:MAG: DUF393 domain-containing protein, partial [Pseudomonadota bacterium]